MVLFQRMMFAFTGTHLTGLVLITSVTAYSSELRRRRYLQVRQPADETARSGIDGAGQPGFHSEVGV